MPRSVFTPLLVVYHAHLGSLELRTLHHLSSPVPPQLLSAQLHTLSQASLSSTATAQVDVPDFISHAIPTYPAPSNTLDPSSLPSVVPHLQVLDSSTAPATSSLLEELPQPVPPEAPAPGSSESPASTVSNGTSVYKDRRARNTEASKRFRANKKAREREVAEQLQELKSDNERLRKRVNSLEKENKLLRSFLTG